MENENLKKIYKYLDTRAILSQAEIETVKKYLKEVVDSKSYNPSYEMLKARATGYIAALITDRLLAIEKDN